MGPRALARRVERRPAGVRPGDPPARRRSREGSTGAPPPDEPPDEPGELVEQPRRPSRWRPHRYSAASAGWPIAVAHPRRADLRHVRPRRAARRAEPRRRGPRGPGPIGPAILPSLKFSVGADPSVLDRVHWKLDGKDVTGDAYFTAGRFVLDGDRLPGRRPPPPGERRRRLSRLAHDEDLALHGRHQGADDRVRPARRPHPVAATRLRSPAPSSPRATLTANGRPVLVQGRPLPDRVDDSPDWCGHARRHRHAPQHEHQAGLDLDEAAHALPIPIRAVHVTSSAWGDDRSAPGSARPDRPGEDQRRRARREGGGRHRRLERARPPRARDRRGPARATTSRTPCAPCTRRACV